MRISILFLSFCLFFWSAQAVAGESRELQLTDGSVLIGKIVSFDGTVYTIKTPSLGQIQIDGSKVKIIRSMDAEADDGSEKENDSALVKTNGIKEKMLQDKEIVNIIMSLQNDPVFESILKDPKLTKAISSGDIGALINNPKIIQLLNNAKVKEITEKVLK